MGGIADNIGSLAMVEAAVASADQRRRVPVAEVMAAAYRDSRRLAAQELHTALDSWWSTLDGTSEKVGRQPDR